MHENIKLLLAGPGTGKTTSIKKLLEDRQPASVLVLSFTNATISDLIDGFSDSSLSIDSSNCMTLHSMALKVNHLENVQILGSDDAKLLNGYAKRMKLDFNFVCQSFNAITFDGMVTSCADFLESNPAYGSEKIGQYELIVVDEFQDFNSSEIALLKQIFIYGEEIIIMGDTSSRMQAPLN
jgi:superfamily I DNA/RNA helicase